MGKLFLSIYKIQETLKKNNEHPISLYPTVLCEQFGYLFSIYSGQVTELGLINKYKITLNEMQVNKKTSMRQYIEVF